MKWYAMKQYALKRSSPMMLLILFSLYWESLKINNIRIKGMFISYFEILISHLSNILFPPIKMLIG